ncbi:MAG TPA: MarR family winged helix-turn-helix transcriptional regulator [Pseudolysinimonas sp.]|nr:MarR family winged helix-turn-helix transcriptional regulator [Pseudolysinimonas sp.]
MEILDVVLGWPDASGAAHAPLRIKYYQNMYTRSADEILSGVGTTMARYVVMTAIENSPGSSGVQLAELTFQRPQSVADVTGALESAGLIERRPGRGRAFGHYLTEAGTAQLVESRAVVTDFHRTIFQGLDDKRLESFLADVELITRNLVEAFPGTTPHLDV